MHNEQVFTPEDVVEIMLDEIGYVGNNIRKKHIIDNSCGDGAILKCAVKRYIRQCAEDGLSTDEISKELSTYIHGIEIDNALVSKVIKSLNEIAVNFSICNFIEWDVSCADTMNVHTFDGKMDYVVGNPPYCNIHDIEEEKREKVKQYKFANGGMTDMYLVFFEIGINMLNENGKLTYITPNSWLTSTAGGNFRKYLKDTNTLERIHQFGHYKVFNKINTYTCITTIAKKSKDDDRFICKRNVSDDENLHYVKSYESLKDCIIDDKIYLSDLETINTLRQINNVDKRDNKRIRVKNGFATLNDSFFIIDEYENKSDGNVLTVRKASNDERHYFFYPYDKNGKPMKWSEINKDLADFIKNKAISMNIDNGKNDWYLYGRTQALNDVKYKKLSVNNLIRNENDLKINVLAENEGVYSGYYIPLYDFYANKYDTIIEAIKNREFVEYVKAVGKYKNGGYYTFSSKELEMWLNYCLSERFLLKN